MRREPFYTQLLVLGSAGGSMTPPPVAHVMSYEVAQGQTGRYVVRSCLGGYNSAFVLSGSEESKVG